MGSWNTLNLKYDNKSKASKAEKELNKELNSRENIYREGNTVYIEYWNTSVSPKIHAKKVPDGCNLVVVCLIEDNCDSVTAEVFSMTEDSLTGEGKLKQEETYYGEDGSRLDGSIEEKLNTNYDIEVTLNYG